MRTANNNFTVENLVAKYRNYVENHASHDFIVVDDDFNGSMEYGLDGWADHQLLITLYNDVAGENADSSIQNKLSKYREYFWKDVLTPEEYAFLIDKFKDTVDYIFSKGLHYGSDATRNTYQLITRKNISFIKKAANDVTATPGERVYIERDILGDGAVLFPKCIILCDDKDNDESALKKIRLFAAGIQYKDVNKIEEETIDIIISNSPSEKLYTTLANNGILFMQTSPIYMVSMEAEAVSFRKKIVADKAIKSIIKYSEGNGIFRYIMIIEKKEHTEVDIQDKNIQQSRKVEFEQITAQILLPGYYLTEKPEKGLPLSEYLNNYDFNHNQSVSVEQLVVFPNNLGFTFKDADLSSKTFKKGTEYGLTPDNPASNCYNVDFSSILLYGDTKDVYVGIAPKVDLPYAVLDPIACFTAKEGIDLRYVASLLFAPIVAKQISAIYQDFYHGNMMTFMPEFLHNIIVPYHDTNERNKYLADTCYDALCTSQAELKQENESYKKFLRMRKHALTQSLSSIESMFYALNAYRISKNGTISDNEKISRVKVTTVHDAFEFIEKNLKDMMSALDHIADVEYTFNKPEWIDPEKFLEGYIDGNARGWIDIKPIMTWEEGNNVATHDVKDLSTGETIIKEGEPRNTFFFPKDALERILNNIISNAQAHGFTDKSRTDYQLRFSWHTDGTALVIEIENNGNPIPTDRDPDSLLEYGVSTALHQDGHNGIGCNEIDDIMRRYDGFVKIISSPESEFTVKYVLTFSRSNILKH